MVSFSSKNNENIIFHSIISSKGSKQIYSLRLQYSLDKENWIDVLDNRARVIEFVSARKSKTNSFKVNIPELCENKDSVWISWKATRIKGKGLYPELNIRNISILADYDKYLGKKPQINIRLRSQDIQTTTIDEIVYNHTPIPYTYPQIKRIVVSGKYLRDEIQISVSGKDDKFFKTDINKLMIDSLGFAFIEVSYSPLKVGSHSATLNLSTKKIRKTSNYQLNWLFSKNC